MARGFDQWLSLTNESAYGVTQTTSPTTDWIPLHSDDAFTPYPKKMYHVIRRADAGNRGVVNVAGRTSIGGRLTTLLYSDPGTGAAVPLCDRLLGWATSLTSSNLPSFTVRHWDGIRAREYLGGMVASAEISASAEQNEGIFALTLDLIFQKSNPVDPTFVAPAQNVFAKAPYRFQETASGLIALSPSGSTKRSIYNSLHWSCKNILFPSWDELDTISDCTYNGRDITFDLTARFVSKTDRDNFESQAAHTISCVMTKVSPAHTLTLTHNAANFITDIGRSFKLGAQTYEALKFNTLDDVAAGGDFSYVAA